MPVRVSFHNQGLIISAQSLFKYAEIQYNQATQHDLLLGYENLKA